MNEQYVTLETAKLLKEKGFDENCLYVYTKNEARHFIPNFHQSVTSYNLWQCPTQQMACRWLREVKGIPTVIEVGWRAYNDEPYYYALYARFDNPDKVFPIQGDFADYQDCVEAAIKFILKNVIK